MIHSQRRIDHLVLAVHDLEAAAAFYTKLGFQVGARNRHPWGTENRLVQFGSSFIELITIGGNPETIAPHQPGRFSFGAYVRDYLQNREGFAMFVLDSADAKADAALFAEKGIGAFEPFFFERKGQRPDGSETHVAFTLAFAMDARLPDASFFVCQQHFPENFWNPDFQRHPNGAAAITAVTLSVAQPLAHAGFLTDFTGIPARETGMGRISYALRGNSSLQVEQSSGDAGFTGYTVSIPDPARQRALLAKAGIPFTPDGEDIAVKAGDAFGAAIRFTPAG